MIKAILFDLDGTLIDTSEYIFMAFEHTLKTHGHKPVSRAAIRKHVGRSLQDSYKAFTNSGAIEALMATHGKFQSLNAHLVKEFLGVADVIKGLHNAGKKIGIVTSRRYYIEETLKIAGLDHKYFKVIVGALDVTNHKPHPEPIEQALKKLKAKPNEAVMVGDGAADIESAKAAKLAAAIGVTHGFGLKSHLKQAGTDYIIASITDLPKLLGTIERS